MAPPSTAPTAFTPPAEIYFLGDALRELFNGNVADFFGNLLKAWPAIGTFIIITLFVGFILRVTVIRDDKHKKVAWWIGVGAALIATMNVGVYSFVKSMFGGWLIWALFGLVAVYTLYDFINRQRAHHFKTSAAAHRGQAEEQKEKRAALKEGHETDLEKKLQTREKKGIDKAQHILNEDLPDEKNVVTILEKLRHILGLIGKDPRSDTAEHYRSQLMTEASAATTHLQRDFKHLKRIDGILNKGRKLVVEGLHIQENQEQTAEHIKKILKERMRVEKDFDATKANNEARKYDEHIKDIAGKIHTVETEKKALFTAAETIDKKAIAQLEKVMRDVSQFTSSASSGDYSTAMTHLNNAENALKTVQIDDNRMKNILQKERAYIAQEQNLENEIRNFVQHVLSSVS